MKELAEWVIRDLFSKNPDTWQYTWAIYLAGMALAAVICLGFVAVFAGPVTWVERRTAGRIMSRIGPNRVGPQGVLQWLADGIKNLLKEDLIPDDADKPLFRLAPYLVFSGMFGTFVVLPFGANLIAADLDIGVLYLMAVTTLVVVGLLTAGWASNSKWALYGGIRSAAQLVSYEVPIAFALLVVVISTGSLSTQAIIKAQGGWPWQWFVAKNPFTFIAFFLLLTSAMAEGNRIPFDLPEAESELVAGYNTEYSGMRFLFFLFEEWANLWIMGAITTLCFLGGWQIPGVSPEKISASSGWTFVGWQLLSFAIFAAKVSWIVFIVIQARWTLPRLRVDQLMSTCWKYLVPMTLVCIAGVLFMDLYIVQGGITDKIIRWIMTLLGAAVIVLFFLRARYNYKMDKDKYPGLRNEKMWYPPYRMP
ncbi:MAG: NADH-quinone oxidoreductase subunit H [Deltaproteobacteria bacterium]|nr:NADH-quinone oxidoreductase subunit H [Deltaproteobacteria bacterium]